MRLLTTTPLHHLIYRCGLAQAGLECARTYLGLSEKLKTTEQRLNFLTACKRHNVIPVFIVNGLRTDHHLFNGQDSSYIKQLISLIRTASLNFHIRSCHEEIREIKRKLCNAKTEIHRRVSDQFMFHEIMCTAEDYMNYVKQHHKDRLKKKFSWLLWKQQGGNTVSGNVKTPETSRQRTPNQQVTTAPSDLVTVLDLDDHPVELDDNEISLLSRGPGFAIAPKINEKLLHEVQINLAQASYGMKWRAEMERNGGIDGQESGVKQLKTACPGLQTPFISTPPTWGVDIDVMMNNFGKFVIDTIRNSNVKTNLTRSQLEGLESLKKREGIHISLSDKCGDFVVSTSHAYKQLTILHLKNNSSVYRWIEPTREVKGSTVQVLIPTDITYNNQLKNKKNSIEKECNVTIQDIVEKRGLGRRFLNLLLSHNTTLPTIYTLVKTHKIAPGVSISTKKLEELKVRPIVSCTGSPTEKLASLVTRIITPLLDFVPCHLKNIHEHLRKLRELNPDDLLGMKFYSADVCALFTNVNVERSIDYVIELANEHWKEIQTFGLELVDVHRILEVVLRNSFFTFNRRLYQQIYGAFIGCSVSPPCAMITVYKMEKESIYIDPFYLNSPINHFYGRYVDDSGSLARSREEAIANCRRISDMDEDGRILWEVEYPEGDEYIPFLDTEIKIKDGGYISTRYYRKPQNKGITLNYNSHHQMSTKEAVAMNYYRTAREVSSDPPELNYSITMVDGLLTQNGYPNPRLYDTKKTGSKRLGKKHPQFTTVCLPYTSESDSNRIRRYIRRNRIPLRPVFTPGKTLRQIFCNSRPLDRATCVLSNPERCTICPIISNGNCIRRGAVYQITCEACNAGVRYQGEADRPLHDRIGEHLRAMKNPSAHPNNAMGQHYATAHPGVKPRISVIILDCKPNTVKRKISEALYIQKQTPELNDKTELESIVKYIP